MKAKFPKHLNQYRIRSGPHQTPDSYEFVGKFEIPLGPITLRIIATDGSGTDEEGCPDHLKAAAKWEHVSVSVIHPPRTPTWEEMCFVKDLFWGTDEVVFQLHPAHSNYVNHHPFVLHLWRHKRSNPPLPPLFCV